MKIYNKEKTQELLLEECDLGLGYFKTCKETVLHDAVKEIEEVGHYETLVEYENGGKDVEWVIDVPGRKAQEAWVEEIEYSLYIPYSENYLKKKHYEEKIREYQRMLAESDFKAIKYMEGWYTDEEYQHIKLTRNSYREEIRRYTELIRNIELDEEEANL